LYIGQIAEVCEWITHEGGDMFSELTPQDHGDEDVEEYMVHVNKYWVRTNDNDDRSYDGPYDTEAEALRSAVEEHIG